MLILSLLSKFFIVKYEKSRQLITFFGLNHKTTLGGASNGPLPREIGVSFIESSRFHKPMCYDLELIQNSKKFNLIIQLQSWFKAYYFKQAQTINFQYHLSLYIGEISYRFWQGPCEVIYSLIYAV